MSQIPNDLAETFELLKKDILWLHVQWKVYRQLFAVSEADIQLLNDAAPLAFGVYQEVLLSSVLLSLTRLTDPETTGKKENLTLERLVSLIDSSTYQALADKARQYLDQACKLCKPFREWRNRRYAHRDWLTAKEVHPDPLPGISRQRIEDTLAIIRNLMDEVSNITAQSCACELTKKE